jgi:hypothetical protein
MTDESIDVQALREAYEASTQEQWYQDPNNKEYIRCEKLVPNRAGGARQAVAKVADTNRNGPNDLAFILVAHNQMPAICDEIEGLRLEQKSYVEALRFAVARLDELGEYDSLHKVIELSQAHMGTGATQAPPAKEVTK